MSVHDLSEPTDLDSISAQARRIDEMSIQVVETNALLNRFLERLNSGNSNNQNFTVSSGGWVSILGACVAVVCVLVTVIELSRQDSAITRYMTASEEAATRGKIETTSELHDLRAWRDVHSNEIGTIKSKVQQLENRK